jgi:hypothetical protein
MYAPAVLKLEDAIPEITRPAKSQDETGRQRHEDEIETEADRLDNSTTGRRPKRSDSAP